MWQSLCSMKSLVSQEHLSFRALCLTETFPIYADLDAFRRGGRHLRQMSEALIFTLSITQRYISRWLTAASLSLSVRSFLFLEICHRPTTENTWGNKHNWREWLFLFTWHPRDMRNPLQMNINIKRKLSLQMLNLIFNQSAYKPL